MRVSGYFEEEAESGGRKKLRFIKISPRQTRQEHGEGNQPPVVTVNECSGN